MFRTCLSTLIPMDIKSHEDGSYEVIGPGGEQYLEFLKIFEQLFNVKNSSIYSTISIEECLERLNDNQSDFTSAMFPHSESSDNYMVHAPFLPSKISFISGYDMNRKQMIPKDCADVFYNLTLLEPSIYFCSFLLIFSLASIISVKTFMHIRMRRRNISSRRKKPYEISFIIKCTLRQMRMALYGRKHRWTGLLLSILLFYLITSFMLIYKTSQIIMDEPFMVKSYQDLLMDKTALPLFYDPVIKVSTRFKNAPKDTLKGKIWSKLIDAFPKKDPIIEKEFMIRGNIPVEDAVKYVRRTFKKMHEDHSIIIGSSATINVLKTFYCGTSPENELWRILTFSDESEHEILMGFALSNFYPHQKFYTQRMRRQFEQYIISHFFIVSQNMIETSQRLSYITSQARKQELACSDSYSVEKEIHVEAITLDYFLTFFLFLIILFMLGVIIFAMEVATGSESPILD